MVSLRSLMLRLLLGRDILLALSGRRESVFRALVACCWCSTQSGFWYLRWVCRVRPRAFGTEMEGSMVCMCTCTVGVSQDMRLTVKWLAVTDSLL